MLTIEIATDNAAFADGNAPTELSRILRTLASDLTNPAADWADTLTGQQLSLRDINGNRVGFCHVDDLDDDEDA